MLRPYIIGMLPFAGTIHRADVAQLACRCLLSEKANNKVLSAIDRNMMYGSPEFEEFVLS